MFSIKQHIQKIDHAAKSWLRPDNFALKEAIDKTVNEGLFSFEDIKHQVLVLKHNIATGQIEEWAKRAGLNDQKNAFGQKVLCLHAGNLPLVGFQTALGTILSGADYYGKLSRKDPYLLATFLDEVKNANPELVINYDINLDTFKDIVADKVIFAGSENSVSAVKKEIEKHNSVKSGAEFVIRTAKFSIAYLDKKDPTTMRDFVEAVFRYGGRGCRSVGVVVTPFRLDSIKCELTDYIEEFWLKNPQFAKPEPVLAYRFAFNKALGKSQAWLNDFLIQESEEMPDMDFTLHWVNGGADKVRELKTEFGPAVQSVYTTGEKIEGVETEFLSQAQTPPLWWKPDGMDLLQDEFGK